MKARKLVLLMNLSLSSSFITPLRSHGLAPSPLYLSNKTVTTPLNWMNSLTFSHTLKDQSLLSLCLSLLRSWADYSCLIVSLLSLMERFLLVVERNSVTFSWCNSLYSMSQNSIADPLVVRVSLLRSWTTSTPLHYSFTGGKLYSDSFFHSFTWLTVTSFSFPWRTVV